MFEITIKVLPKIKLTKPLIEFSNLLQQVHKFIDLPNVLARRTRQTQKLVVCQQIVVVLSHVRGDIEGKDL